ncbi:hypothetical protein BDZ94DRAFT_1275235 [Collybia nuda]|uniref:Uncharacterized protein n=1 Tax=Collybia nuda TaxID=64659 RepID=A0A9P6CD29_9AGAR|nr:hypothetical protein BDZ94DRAFT_1275235 [Collybia nuda]
MVALFSRSVLRMTTWFTMLICWALYSASFLFLVGRQTGPEPSLGLCTFQAGLVYGAPPLVSCASLIFVIELYLRLTAVTLSRSVNERIVYWMPWTLPVVHSTGFWVGILLGLSDVKTIERSSSGLYCRVNQNTPSTFAGALVVLFAGSVVILEVYIVIHLYHRRMFIKKIDARKMVDFPLKPFISMAAFTILGGLAVIMVFVVEVSDEGSLLNILTVLPLAVGLIFGSQTDILVALMFWRKQQLELVKKPTSKSPV